MTTHAVRLATSDDFPEILRLAMLMWSEMDLPAQDAKFSWEEHAAEFFSRAFEEGRLRGFVVDHPSGPGLISCGMGLIYEQMPAYWLPSGRMGYAQWFSTEPEFRRQGLATAILKRVLEWFEAENITRAQLHGSEDALSVYRKAGFEGTLYANLWWRR